MRWLITPIFALLVLALTPSVMAISIECPTEAEVEEPFDITVSHAGAEQVRVWQQSTSQWHTATGSENTFEITEFENGERQYFADAYYNGGWQGDGSTNCIVSITQSDSPGSFSEFTINNQETDLTIQAGESINIKATYQDDDGVDEIRLLRDGSDLDILGNPYTSCSGAQCTYEAAYEPASGSTSEYSAEGFDINRNSEFSQGITVAVSGVENPSVQTITNTPSSIEVGDTVTFTVTAEEGTYALSGITYDFADGSTPVTKSCGSGVTCELQFVHEYGGSGTFNTQAVVSDVEGNEGFATRSVTVHSPADSDGDGVSDENDVCLNTLPGDEVATQGAYVGCSCTQAVSEGFTPEDDNNACTLDYCGIVDGTISTVYENNDNYFETSCNNNDLEVVECLDGEESVTTQGPPRAPFCSGDGLNEYVCDETVGDFTLITIEPSFSCDGPYLSAEYCVDGGFEDSEPVYDPVECGVEMCEFRCSAQLPEYGVEQAGFCEEESGVCFKCPENFVYDDGECENLGFEITNVNDVSVDKGGSFSLDPVTIRAGTGEPVQSGYEYEHPDHITRDGGVFTTSEVGSYTLHIKAYSPTTSSLRAERSIEVRSLCTGEDECCEEGTTQPTPGVSCGDNGVCNANGVCLDQGPNQCEDEETYCNDECVNTQTDRDHCGECNNECATNQLCQEGACTTQENCFVACDDNTDCSTGQVCRQAGLCEAYCHTPPTLEQTQEQVQTFTAEIAGIKSHEVTKTLIDNTLTIEVINLIPSPLENFTMTITIPKELSSSASMIGSDKPFEVLVEDPVIRTTINELNSRETTTYELENPGNPDLLEQIFIETNHSRINLTGAGALSEDELAITKDVTTTPDGTRLTIRANPGANLEDVKIPIDIPTCLAEHISELDINRDDYVIVSENPIIVWTLDNLNSREEITFTVPKTVEEDCHDQLRAFGFAGDIKEPLSPWIPLAIIPVIAFTLVFFQRYQDPGAQEHMSKKEFYKFGKEQGQDEEELEKAWHDYKRRF